MLMLGNLIGALGLDMSGYCRPLMKVLTLATYSINGVEPKKLGNHSISFFEGCNRFQLETVSAAEVFA